MTYLGWLKVCFLSSGEQYASFGTYKQSVEQFLKKIFFAISTFLPFGANFIYLGASIRIIPCSWGQYASFGTTHAYLNKTKFQNVKFSKNQKRASPFLYVCQSEVVQSMLSELRGTIRFFWYPTSLV